MVVILDKDFLDHGKDGEEYKNTRLDTFLDNPLLPILVYLDVLLG